MKEQQSYIAHIRYDGDKEVTHHLEDHLQEVGDLAARFAGQYGAEFAKQAGFLHDLGKARLKFSQYIQKAARAEKEDAHVENEQRGRVTHSTAGAKYAVDHFDPVLGYALAYLIAGHHAGLADWQGKRPLKTRLAGADAELQESLDSGFPVQKFLVPEESLIKEVGGLWQSSEDSRAEFHIWLRYIFSCLVDADFLDTEAFMAGYQNADEAKQHGVRPSFPSLLDLQTRYQQHMEKLKQKAVNSPLQKIRVGILESCLSKAEQEASIFSLTVPTGGGKTLASLGFALKHALKFNKQRIIYAIPFTSIIEQNAEVFRRALGDEALIEHHSNLEVDEKKENSRRRVAAENWEAPLIVTTNVQLFESLFAARTSRCRKIHNIANSVIILDEAQQLPRDFQKPITDMMRVLAKKYGVTFVLCTATQPELGEARDVFDGLIQKGLDSVVEIIPNPEQLAQQLKRVEVKFPVSDTKQSWEELAEEIQQKPCVLAVVNTRNHAKALFNALPDNGIKLHLSANMCATHRSEVIALVRLYLQAYHQGQLDKPLWLISTQLIEAGVDLDFPVVYRQMAGLDSIAQAAGRCNREARLSMGEVVVFRTKEKAPAGILRQGQDITEEMLKIGLLADPLSPQAFKDYFVRLNAKGERDKHGICSDLRLKSNSDDPLEISFRTAADKFRMIDQNGVALIVPYAPLMEQQKTISSRDLDAFLSQYKEDLLSQTYPKNLSALKTKDNQRALPEPLEGWFRMLENDKHQTWIYRRLQRYTITVPEFYLKNLPANAVYERAGLLVLDAGFYDEVFGAIRLDDTYQQTPETSVI